MISADYGDWSQLMALRGMDQPEQLALDDGETRLNWGEMTGLIDRIASQLIADGLQRGQAVAILGTTNIRYALVYFAAIRAGGCAAPLTTSASAEQLTNMFADSGARHLFIDSAKQGELESAGARIKAPITVMLDQAMGDDPFIDDWMAADSSGFEPLETDGDDPFNIIYSSGTTGTPKGIVHSRAMRWKQFVPGFKAIYNPQARSIVSTPLYSNTTLAVFLPTIIHGGCAFLMGKFDAAKWLQNAQGFKATHTMLVPVQYQRLLAHPDFDRFDLSSMQLKFCTSAPFSPELKAETLRRFPGGLVEIYGMTEGGVVCMLRAHEFPEKLHTVGQPIEGHQLMVIDEQGRALPPGSRGEMVGRSGTMMSGYKNQPDKTSEMIWHDEEGNIWFKTGDIGIIDEDGFVAIVGRAKDMIISGGFNIYPKDLEALLMEREDVADAAVVGVPSEKWGETPVGFVVLAPDCTSSSETILSETNARLGKTQRLSELHIMDSLPRSHIGKVLKTELRSWLSQAKAER